MWRLSRLSGLGFAPVLLGRDDWMFRGRADSDHNWRGQAAKDHDGRGGEEPHVALPCYGVVTKGEH